MSWPSISIAALMGIGLVKAQHVAAQGEELEVQAPRLGQVAAVERPQHGDYVSGTMLPTTETTPRPPSDINGSVRLSSPLSSVRSLLAMICETRPSSRWLL